MKLISGRRYRVVETYESGTVLTYEGTIVNSADTQDHGATVEFRDAGTAWVDDREDCKVTVEPLRDLLPTALGSLIRYYPSTREHPDVNVIQMRVPTTRQAVTDEGQPVRRVDLNWVTAMSGLRVTDPLDDFDVIFDAGAEQ